MSVRERERDRQRKYTIKTVDEKTWGIAYANWAVLSNIDAVKYWWY